MKNNITICKNGFIIRLHNRRIEVVKFEKEDAFKISCAKFDKDKDSYGAYSGKIKGKNIMFSEIFFSRESLEAIVQGYQEFLKSKSNKEPIF